jgi:integrase
MGLSREKHVDPKDIDSNSSQESESNWKTVAPGVIEVKSTKSKRKSQRTQDICYYIRYPAPGKGNKRKTEKIGWKSEGYSKEIAQEIRGDRVRKIRHEGKAKTSKEITAEIILKEEEKRKKQEKLNRSVDYIATEYFREREGDLKGYATDLNRYERHIKQLLGDKPVKDIVQFDVNRIEKTMASLAPATASNAIELLRRLLNYGAKRKMCQKPDFIITPKKKDNFLVEYLKPEEAQRLNKVFKHWGNRDAVRMLRLAMVTGMRRGEIFKLEDRDLDFSYNLIKIREPKGGKTETIPMNLVARGIIEEQIESRKLTYPESSVVFPGAKGRNRKDCSAAKRIKQAAELPKSFRIFHGLRHHFAVTLANSGEFSIDEIAELLTHKDPRLTKERYGQFLPETKQRLSNKAADLLMQGMVDDTETPKSSEGNNKAENAS